MHEQPEDELWPNSNDPDDVDDFAYLWDVDWDKVPPEVAELDREIVLCDGVPVVFVVSPLVFGHADRLRRRFFEGGRVNARPSPPPAALRPTRFAARRRVESFGRQTVPDEQTDERVDESTQPNQDVDENSSPDSETTSDDETSEQRRDRRYRAELRRVEQERDSLRAALAEHVRRDVEALASERLQDGSALWLVASDPLDLVDESFTPDRAKIEGVIDALIARAPALRKLPPSFDVGARESSDPATSWQRLIAGGA